MEGLQRSDVSFRRQGSSGLVWDDKFLSGELNRLADQQKQHKSRERGGATAAVTAAGTAPELTIQRSRSEGGRGYRAGREQPALEPPSPRVSACGFCGVFGGKGNTRRRPSKPGKRVR